MEDLISVTVALGLIDLEDFDANSTWKTEITNMQHIVKHPNADPDFIDTEDDIAMIFLEEAPEDLIERPNIGLIDLPIGYEEENFDWMEGEIHENLEERRRINLIKKFQQHQSASAH